MRQVEADTSGAGRDRFSAGPVRATAAFVAMGLFTGCFSALLPALQHRTHTGDAAFGLVLLLGNLGALPGTLVLGPWLCHRGRGALAIACLLAALSLIPLGLATGAAGLAASLAAASLCLGAVDVSTNAVLVAHERSGGRTLLQHAHASYPVAAVVGSLVGALTLLLRADLEVSFVAIAAAMGLVAVVNARQPSPAVGDGQAELGSAGSIDAGQRLLSVVALLGAIGLLCYAVESALANWAADTLVQAAGAGVVLAAMAPAMHNLGMTAGRLLTGRRHGDAAVVAAMRRGSLLAALGILLIAVVPGAPAELIGFGLAGFGVASWAPGLFGLSGHAAHRLGAPLLMGMTTSMAYVGLIVMPGLIGLIGGVAGLRLALAVLLLPVAGAGILLSHPASRRRLSPTPV